MRLSGTVYVTDHRARIGLRRGTLLIQQEEGWTRIPIEAVDGLILTSRAEVSNQALGELVRRGIRVSALSRTGRLRFFVGGPVSGNVHLRVAQTMAATDTSRANQVARWVVAGKLQNCRHSIQRWSWDATGNSRWVIEQEGAAVAERVGALPTAPTGDHIRGIEGDGTRRYFRCLGLHLRESEFWFTQRNRRPPRDPVNALLGFAYGLLVAELVGAADAVGLDPQIGFLHGLRSGRPALALDLLEELRPSVADRFVVNIAMRHIVNKSHFRRVGQACFLTDAGRDVVLSSYEKFREEEVFHPVLNRHVGRWALPTVQATLMARFLRGDIPCYPPYVAA